MGLTRTWNIRSGHGGQNCAPHLFPYLLYARSNLGPRPEYGLHVQFPPANLEKGTVPPR